jgi:hypothetical protein
VEKKVEGWLVAEIRRSRYTEEQGWERESERRGENGG